jgi:hypothetical protein
MFWDDRSSNARRGRQVAAARSRLYGAIPMEPSVATGWKPILWTFAIPVFQQRVE